MGSDLCGGGGGGGRGEETARVVRAGGVDYCTVCSVKGARPTPGRAGQSAGRRASLGGAKGRGAREAREAGRRAPANGRCSRQSSIGRQGCERQANVIHGGGRASHCLHPVRYARSRASRAKTRAFLASTLPIFPLSTPPMSKGEDSHARWAGARNLRRAVRSPATRRLDHDAR